MYRIQDRTLAHNHTVCPPLAGLALCAVIALLTGCAGTGMPRIGLSRTGPDPFTITARADSAYQRGDWLVAEKYYEELTRVVPKDAYGWTRLGNLRLKQNKFRSAVHAYEAAIERDSEAPRAHYNLATAHLLLAREALQQARQNLPVNDEGANLIQDKLGHFDALVYEPIVEVTSPNEGLIQRRRPSNQASALPTR